MKYSWPWLLSAIVVPPLFLVAVMLATADVGGFWLLAPMALGLAIGVALFFQASTDGRRVSVPSVLAYSAAMLLFLWWVVPYIALVIVCSRTSCIF